MATSAAAGASALVQANAICARRNRELTAASRRATTLEQIVATASRRAAIQRTALAELEQLSPPASAARDWRTMLAATTAAMQGTENLARSAGSKSRASLAHEVELLDRPRLGLIFAGSRAGVKQCSAVAGPSVLGL